MDGPITRPVRVVLVGLVLLVGVALVGPGCGSEDRGDSPRRSDSAAPAVDPVAIDPAGRSEPAAPFSDEDAIRASLASLLTSAGGAAGCEGTMTASFLRASYGDIHGCEAARRPAALADRLANLRVAAVDPGAERATATMRPRGGVYDRVKLSAELVRDGDRWLLDALDADVAVGP